MTFCKVCGATWEAGSRFCTTCGTSAGEAASASGTSEWGAQQPPTRTAPVRPVRPGPDDAWAGSSRQSRPAPSLPLPAWATTDWPLIGLCVLLMLGALMATCAVFGALLSVVATGGLDAVVDGATAGLYMAFAAFGAKTVVTSGPDLPNVFLAFQFLPLPLGALGLASTWLALRFAESRLPTDRASLLVFAGKLAVTFGIVIGVLAAVLSIGDMARREGFTATVSGGEAWVYGTLIVGLGAVLFLRLQGVRILPDRLSLPGVALLPYAVDGAKAFGVLVVGITPLAFVAAMIAVDGNSQRLGVLLGMLGFGLTMGIVASAFAMGASVGLVSGHTSLLHFGFPPGSDAGAAPLPFFVLLFVAPAIVAWIVHDRLEQDRPVTEQDAIRVGFATALAFALTAWLAVLVSRVNLVAAVGENSGDGVGTFLSAKPSPGAVLGLALVWGLAGGLGMALLWARQQGAGWRVSEPAVERVRYQPADRIVDPWERAQPVVEWACPACGSEVVPGGRFCPECGSSVST